MSDVVVYKQDELLQALKTGFNHITLCAGFFEIPKTVNVLFDRIGPVKVNVLSSRGEAEEAGMRFDGIYPKFEEESERFKSSDATTLLTSGSYAITSGIIGSGAICGSGSCTISGSFYDPYGDGQSITVFGYGIDLI